MRKHIKKSLLISFIISEVFLLNAPFVFARGIKVPSPSKVAAELESRYHMNLEEIQGQGESFNTSSTKMMAPQVSLSFNPSNPKLGERVTASAMPMFFINPNEKLYFTWYVQHPDCVKASAGSAGYKKKCDLNNDDRVNVEDWKIEAMRQIASNGFNTNNANYSNPTNDNDGYDAVSGGDDRKGMPVHCYIHDFNTGINYELVKKTSSQAISCANGGTPVCVRGYDTLSSDLFNLGDTTNNQKALTEGTECLVTGNSPICATSSATSTCASGETALCVPSSRVGSDNAVLDASGDNATCSTASSLYSAPACSASTSVLPENLEFMCNDKNKRHLFPYPSGGSSGDTGNGSFGTDEERFWRTNPENPSTAGNGNLDEANVTGMGQDTFTWNYEPGDKVGVAVEGTAITATKYADSSMMIMWALPKNKCDLSSTSYYYPSIKGYRVKIPITSIASSTEGQSACIDGNCLNDCLEKNLVEVGEAGEFSKLTVDLSYDPQNPINNSSENESGDELIIQSSVQNAKNPNYLKYSWEVYRSDEINPSDWGNPMLKSELPGISQTAGIGLNSLRLNLNLKNPPKYLKVKLSATENVAKNVTNEGRSEIIIPISSSSNKIKVYPVAVSDNLILSLEDGKERCQDGLEALTCPVVKNEFVGVKVDKKNLADFAWTIDGAPVVPITYEGGAQCLSGECDPATGENTNIMYFPVLKNTGNTYAIGLTASAKDSGEKVNLAKTFEVVDPKITIRSGDKDTAQPILMGNYIDLSGKSWPDYSTTNYVGLTNSTLKLAVSSNTPYLADHYWSIDGDSPENAVAFDAGADKDGSLSFFSTKLLGEDYSVGVTSVYAQSKNVRAALHKYWGIQLNEFYEKQISDTIEIKLVDSFAGSAGAKKPQNNKLLASLFTGVPAYVNFLFRIVLTIAVLILVSRIIFTLFPKINENQNKY